MVLEHLYTDSVDILRATVSAGATRQVTQTWGTIASGVVCEIQPKRQDYILTAKGFVKDCDYYSFFELTVDIAKGDRLIYNGLYLNVLSVKEIRWHHYEVRLDEVAGEAPPTPPSGS